MLLAGSKTALQNSRVDVSFKRTGVRRYAVTVAVAGEPVRALNPAPGYDDDIPHDLVHYVVEAELGLTNGVYGRAARGAGSFITTSGRDQSPRERARRQRKQRRREKALHDVDARHEAEMAKSERFTALCDITWRRKHGQRPDPLRSAPDVGSADVEEVERVVSRLDAIAPLWRNLPLDQELVFQWPKLEPTPRYSPGDVTPGRYPRSASDRPR